MSSSMYEIKPSRGLLSAYYIAILFSGLAFSLPFFQDIVYRGQEFFITFIQKISNSSSITSWISYGSLIFVSFLIVFLAKRYIVEPLGFFMEDEENLTTWEIIIFIFLVIGSFLYYINTNFSQLMPLNIPQTIVELVGGQVASPVFGKDFVDTLWKIGPILFMFITFRSRNA